MTMILIRCALVLLFVVSTLAQKDLVIDCKVGTVTIKWRPGLNWAQKVDPSKAHLGSCPSSSLPLEEDVLLFSVWLHDCGFRRQVSVDKVTYTNELTYGLGAGLPAIVEPVQCDYDVSGKRIDLERMKNDVIFIMEFMNSDFSGPAPSTLFTLGSRISLRARVEQQNLTPVQIYLQRCVLAKTPDLTRASQQHALVSDSGCLTESKMGNATFLQRREPSEICLYFQAFKFALDEQIFLHCDMTAWDFQSFSVDKKACHYLKYQKRWELLDDPAQSYICSCCDSTCMHGTNVKHGLSAREVLGPFTIVDSQPSASDQYAFWPAEQGPGGVPVWPVALAVFLVLVLMAGAIGTSYYLCIWRGGRIGYRPSRDLLNKY